MRKGGYILFLMIVFSMFVFSNSLTPSEKLAYKVKPSIVLIKNTINVKIRYITGGKIISDNLIFGSSGSGFFVHPEGYIITTGYSVKDAWLNRNDREKLRTNIVNQFILKNLRDEGIQINLNSLRRWKRIHRPVIEAMETVNEVILSNGEKFPYEIKKYSPSVLEGGSDIAIIKISRSNCPVLMLGDSSKVVLNQEIFAFGYPALADSYTHIFVSDIMGIQPTITKGIISSVKSYFKNLPVILTDANLQEGNSGGPAVNEDGRVVAVIAYMRYAPDENGIPREVNGYKFLIPINVAKEFLADAGVPINKLSEFTKVYNKLLETYWKGDLFKARELVEVTLASMGNQPDLIKLRENILRDVHSLSPIKRLWMQSKYLVIPSVLIIILIIVVLIIALKPAPRGQFRPKKSKKEEREIKEDREIIPEKEEEKESVGSGKVVIFIRGNEVGVQNIPEEGAVIGRDPSRASVVIAEPIVSKVHCKIIPKEGKKFLVVDLNSTNGTYVAGKRISQHTINSGEAIQLGKKGDIILVVKKI